MVGENLYPDLYDVRVSSAIISGQWKLITGDPWGDDAVWMQGEQMCCLNASVRGRISRLS